MQTKILKKSLPIFIVLFGLFFAAAVSFGLYAYAHQKPRKDVMGASVSVEKTPETPSGARVIEIAPSPTPSTVVKLAKKTFPAKIAISPSSTPASNPSQVATVTQSQTSQIESTPSPPTNVPTSTPQVQKFSVSVSIDGGGSFSLEIDNGKNQCDVLSRALSEGKISSLNMQYNSAFGSNAVYQINGLGQEGQVWWTYSVNDKKPPLGCSHVTVNGNDNVRWTYIGPR